MLENEMAMNADNLKSIVAQGNEMARAGHFDSAGILKAVKEFDQRYVLRVINDVLRHVIDVFQLLHVLLC
jgi:hypothetical protein